MRCCMGADLNAIIRCFYGNMHTSVDSSSARLLLYEELVLYRLKP